MTGNLNSNGTSYFYFFLNLLMITMKKSPLINKLVKIVIYFPLSQSILFSVVFHSDLIHFQRASLLESLQKFQASHEELSKLTSIASIQTKGLKRHFFEEANPDKVKPKNNNDISNGDIKLNSISGAKRRKLIQDNINQKTTDPNIVGFDSSSSDSGDSEEETPEDEGTKDVQVKQEEFESQNENVDDVEVTIVEENREVQPIEIKDDSDKVIKKKKSKILPSEKPAVYVHVMRNDGIQKARLKLPILSEEQQIMETINENSIILLAGLLTFLLQIWNL